MCIFPLNQQVALSKEVNYLHEIPFRNYHERIFKEVSFLE